MKHMFWVLVLAWAVSAGAGNPAGQDQPRNELLEAAGKGELDTVRTLLKNGAEVHLQDEEGHTALHRAAIGGHVLTAEALLDGGADINAKDKCGHTPLDESVIHEHEGIRDLLHKRGAREGNAHGGIHPGSKIQTVQDFEKAIGEPAILLDSEHICFFAARAKAQEAKIVFDVLVKAYDELYAIVGVHTEYKLAVYAFPKGDSRGWGGTSNCRIDYDDSNLDLQKQPEWVKHHVPHVSGYIEEMAHNFVSATGAQFGWEMIGWSIGIKVSQRVAGNPILKSEIRQTRTQQEQTYLKYIQNRFVFPKEVPANLCDRIHAWILWQAEKEYGPDFWNVFFAEVRNEASAFRNADKREGDDARNERYRITVDCFDRLKGLRFKERLYNNRISLKTDVKSLHPTEPGWNRRFME